MDMFKKVFAAAQQHLHKVIALPVLLSLGTWAGNFLLAISDDGTIDDNEFHALLQTTSGLESIVLVAVMVLLKLRK